MRSNVVFSLFFAMGERLLAVALKEFTLTPDRGAQRAAASVLLRLVRNLRRAPGDPKYERVNLENPVLNRDLLGMRGARTALRAVGFGIGESGECYEYNGTDLGRSQGFLEAFIGELDRQDASGEGGGGGGGGGSGGADGYKARQGPSAEDGFKRFADGQEGLRQRWAELEFVLRDPITSAESLAAAQDRVAAATQFLQDLEATAKEVDLLQGIILQSIVGDGQGHGGSGVALEGKVEDGRVEALKSGSLAIRSLVRLKVTDDADLDTARRAVLDCGQFFKLLAAEADTQELPAFALLQQVVA